MTDQMLRDAMAALADRAEPVNDFDEITGRALRTATRRRIRTVTGAAVLAVALAVPVAAVTAGEHVTTAVLGSPDKGRGRLPDNTSQELALARACMRDGSAVGSTGGAFRLLTKMRVKGGQLAEVGSRRGYVLCVTDGKGNTEPPQVHPWPGESGGGLFGFDAPLRVDGIQQIQALKANELHAVVVGRAKPGVTRITVVWAGGRTGRAAVQNGFFLAQTPASMLPDPEATGPMSKGAAISPTIRVRSVTGYDAEGKALHTWRPKVRTEKTGFTPEDCTDGLTRPRPALCD